MARVAKIVVELALDREFDYIIPDAMSSLIRLGSRVQVPFGRSVSGGYVVGFADNSQRNDLKAIEAIVGHRPLLDESMLMLARWMAEYYAATIEQCIRTALPCAVRRHKAGFKEQSLLSPAGPAGDAAAVEALRLKSPKQAAVLELASNRDPMTVSALADAAGVSASVVNGLLKKGFLASTRSNLQRDPFAGRVILPTQPLKLFPEQAEALALVKQSVDTLKPPVILLHGVTGSGKTEIYMQAMDYVTNRGMGAIILVPEISLTPQTVDLFRGRFGNSIAVLHSHLSEGERHDEWHRIHEGEAQIVIGARSALFAPVVKLGLIVVDEEHEPSYKQSEVPRYNARDVAVMRGHLSHCAVLLGSASPALESFRNTMLGKYAIANLTHRVDHRKMPTMRIVDMRVEAEREGRVNVFSRDLLEAIRSRLDQAEQTILFLNRRGFATSMICPLCGHVAVCEDCSISMTYHKGCEELRCHVCGRVKPVPPRCPGCGQPALKFTGIGTQRIEAVLHTIFPKARVQRMDSDTTRGKDSHQRFLDDFRAGRTDILVGTQMIAKGLHFPGVTLVGVINADLSLHVPDFRAAERTFQLLLQVAGRAGRGDVEGEVIVQTFTPFNTAIQCARRLDYRGFADQEMESRRELVYPPFSHLVCVTLDGTDNKAVADTGASLAEQLKIRLKPNVTLSGPIPAPLERAKRRYRHQLIMRAPATTAMTRPLKDAIRECRRRAGVRIAVDVDAISMM